MKSMLLPSVERVHRRVWEAVKDFWIPNAVFGHGIDHAQRAYQLGLHIARKENANILPVGVACYLMDAGLSIHEGRANHVVRGLEIAAKLLSEIPELSECEQVILDSIRHHDADHDLPSDSAIEVLIVRDSDTLDRMGFSGIRMTLMYGTWIARPTCSRIDPLCANRIPQLDNYTMDYIRHLFSLESWLSTSTAKNLGATKVRELEIYLKAFDNLLRKSRIPSYDEAFTLLQSVEDEEESFYDLL